MSDAEIVVYLFGASLRGAGEHPERAFEAGRHDGQWKVPGEVNRARRRLGAEQFDYWCRRGYHEAG